MVFSSSFFFFFFGGSSGSKEFSEDVQDGGFAEQSLIR